jgi:signal transduction histidine kinase/ligand-binding sensor domain-containing protein
VIVDSRSLARRAFLALITLLPLSTGAVDRERFIHQLHHTAWTARDGAPADVAKFAQTEDGFLWLATGSGLIRFDGAQFERYVPNVGQDLPAASIRTLLALPGNGLLIGWVFGGATLIRAGYVTNYGEREGYPPGTTYQFLRDTSGVIWAATSSGLARLYGEHWRRIGADWNLTGLRALSMFEDRDETLAVFTDQTLTLLSKGARSFRSTGGRSTSFVPIRQAPDGTHYVSDGSGIRAIASLVDYETASKQLVSNPPRGTVDFGMIVDRDGGLWFSSEGGIGRIASPRAAVPRIEYYSKADGLTDPHVSTSFEDRDGTIWVATAAGIDQFREASFLPPAGLLTEAFPAMLPALDGGLWFAGLDSDLRRLTADGSTRTVQDILVTCAYRDPSGVEWYGSQLHAPGVASLVSRDHDRVLTTQLPPDVTPGLDIQAITKDAAGALWVSVIRRGVYRLANGAWTKPPNLPDSGKGAAIVMQTGSDGRVWLGYTSNRVAVWDNGNLHIFSEADGLGVGNVLAIKEKGHHMWVGGDHGIALFEDGRFRTIATADPLVLRGITGIVETAYGDLWLHGIAGAIQIAAAEVNKAVAQPGYAMAFRLYDDDDGLYGVPTDIRPLPTLVEGVDGRLWFGTNQGVFALDPSHIVSNAVPPVVTIRQLIAGDRRYSLQGGVQLPPLSSSVEFDYTAAVLAIGQRARFRYRLDGVDPDWRVANGRRQAFYTNLQPGHYRFQVLAANENGVWSTAGATAEVTILPAWYQTVWFKVLCAAIGGTVLVIAYQIRVRLMRRQIHARLQERIFERERIARDLHDTMIQGFQGLVLLFGSAVNRIPKEYPSRALLAEAVARANEVLADGRDRVRGLRTSFGLEHDLIGALNDAAGDLLRGQPVEFAMAVTGIVRPLNSILMEEAYQIIREALANAAHHAQSRHIQLNVEYATSYLRLRVVDDGAGIEPPVLEAGRPGHWGLTGMRERAARVGAKLVLRSSSDSGTVVELQIPAAVAYRASGSRQTWWRRLFNRLTTIDDVS